MIPKQVEELLKQASFSKTASQAGFTCQICGNEWDNFIEEWAYKTYIFVANALGPYAVLPRNEILEVSDGAHAAGANASFEPDTGQIRLCPSYVQGKPGITLEKLTHELVHASLDDFPEGDSFYEEGGVDYSTWVLAHAPIWGQHRQAMIDAASYNIKLRRDRALKTQTDYDIKRWAGGLYASTAYGPHIIARFHQKKMQRDFTW
jgi:hypothetical protein